MAEAAAVKKTATKKVVQVKEFTYTWEATDRKGAKIKGSTIGPSEAAIKAQLRKQGLNPIKLAKKSSFKLGGKGKIESSDIAIFSRQMATMMTAGVPLVHALENVGREIRREMARRQHVRGAVTAEVRELRGPGQRQGEDHREHP